MNKKDPATKTPLLVKRSDSVKGSKWHEFANKRIIKQHGGFDIPEDDLHAVHKFANPVLHNPVSEEESKDTINGLEEEIKSLKDLEQQLKAPSKPPKDFEEYFDDEPIERDHSDDDNQY